MQLSADFSSSQLADSRTRLHSTSFSITKTSTRLEFVLLALLCLCFRSVFLHDALK